MVLSQVTRQHLLKTQRAGDVVIVTSNIVRAANNYKCHLIQHTVKPLLPTFTHPSSGLCQRTMSSIAHDLDPHVDILWPHFECATVRLLWALEPTM